MILRHNTSGDIAITDGTGYAIGAGPDQWSELPPPIEGVPANRQAWDGTAWVADMAALRADRWASVKDLRSLRENGGCATPKGAVNSDEKARLHIAGAVTMAMIAQRDVVGQLTPAAFSISWTMRDNSSVTHNAQEMVAMGVAVGQHVAAVHARAKALRAQIDASETLEELSAIDIEAGWPGL